MVRHALTLSASGSMSRRRVCVLLLRPQLPDDVDRALACQPLGPPLLAQLLPIDDAPAVPRAVPQFNKGQRLERNEDVVRPLEEDRPVLVLQSLLDGDFQGHET